MSSFAAKKNGADWKLACSLCILLVICLWRLRTEAVATTDGLRFIAQLLTVVGSISVALMIGTLVMVRRGGTERRKLEAMLGEQTAELRAQTTTAAALARDVEAARAEVQKFNDFQERGRAEERLSDRRLSKTALRKEVIKGEATAISLLESQSELVLARDEIERASAEHTGELERSNHELEQFAYVASHDLQEPLRAISGCVEILELRYAPQLDARGHELIEHAVAGVGRMRELIEDLLEYSRVRLGGALESVSAETALSAALRQLESAVEKTGAVVEHGELPTVHADPNQLVQLLQNLIGNALKYRGTMAPRIKVSALRAKLTWVFAVSDNGIGIEPQYFERIFSIFQRLHTREEYPGTGIGLAICRRIVEQAGGSIWINSELGKGSTFYFSLPAIG
jgi:signal transduction histidine kinase